MSVQNRIDDIFFNRMDKEQTIKTVQNALLGCNDGELFMEQRFSEQITFDDGHIKTSSFDATSGFGLRAVCEDTYAYAISNDLTLPSLRQAAESVQPIKKNHANAELFVTASSPAKALYTDINPLPLVSFENKIDLMKRIDSYLRGKESKIAQVSASLSGEWQAVKIIGADGREACDIRPLVFLNISVIVKNGDKMESGAFGMGGRYAYDRIIGESVWKAAADEALRTALVNLDSVAAPAGEMPVVLGSGWSGVLLHEAVGHGLEGDFNRKGSSVFTGKIGEQVAAKGITVVDDGTLPDRRGSITIDDEGTASQRTVLIEDGILKNYMLDRMNARLMNKQPTGNGRRESFSCAPQVRMTNTFMTGGDKDPQEIIASVKKGVYAKSFHGGQVDITSGKFVFTSSEAYLIEDGKLTAPIKDATLIGSGIDVMNNIDMIANDSCLDNGIGSCGKGGQIVPVGVGLPSVRISKITVGGAG
ncbi:MAG: metalloprotease TldD [Alphaproteobacteria bacterium]|nr:metalloprotease TldD [Alphaproteobacteria bacterium]